MTAKGAERGLEPRDCTVCGTRFQPYRFHNVTCGKRSCRDKAKEDNPRREDTEIQCRYCDAIFTAPWSGFGRPPPCPTCAAKLLRAKEDKRNAKRRLDTASDPDAQRAINLRYNLQKYGITPEQLQAKIDAQDNLCMICGNPPKPDGVRAASRLHQDHDHITGQNRDLLCNHCNRGVGAFMDDPELLRKAAEYIERHRAPTS